jgi:hypothetical protein
MGGCLMALAGCASAPIYYTRAGGSSEDFQRELAGCRNRLAMVPMRSTDNLGGLEALGAGLGNMATRDQFMQDCLRSQGWVPQYQEARAPIDLADTTAPH